MLLGFPSVADNNVRLRSAGYESKGELCERCQP
jgi:hypothetical protein